MDKVTKVYAIRFTEKELSFLSRVLMKVLYEDGVMRQEALAIIKKIAKEYGK